MVSELEKWTNDARRYGFPEWAVDYIEAGAEVFRKHDLPEHFPSEWQESMQIRPELIDILFSVNYEKGGRILTPELAKEIYQKIGQHLRDSVPIRELMIPSVGTEKNVGRLNSVVCSAYNRALKSLTRAGYSEVGSIRHTDNYTLGRRTFLGDIGLAFVKSAFAPPQQ